MIRRAAAILALCFFFECGLFAEEKIDAQMNWKIRQEEIDHSQVMRLVHTLTDAYGPRLTGSPNFKAACDWAIRQMQEWGLKNGHLEPWNFGYPGWNNDKRSARVLSPYRDQLAGEVIAWTPGTKGVIRAQAVQIKPPDRPTQEALTAYLNTVKEKVNGKIVLVGEHKPVPVLFNPPAKRLEDAQARSQFDPASPAALADAPGPAQIAVPPNPAPLEARQIAQQVDAFLLFNGARVKILDAARNHGQIGVFANRTYDPDRAIPGLVIRSDDYGRMARVLADGAQVEMEIEISNSTYPEGRTAYNVVGEIPGGEKKDEIVMLGGHIDSWHVATGATDNATGVSVMMEAVRILQRLGIKPRRTIRVALWGGEEQGLLGSKAYVKEHFGTYESPTSEFSRLVGYINIDMGTGRPRGATIFGPPEAATALRAILQPFEDLGFMGVIGTRNRSYGGTDSTSFNWAGLAGILMKQDPIEYETDTWHSNIDTYERVSELDLKQSAIVIASAIYHLAMREEMLPKFPQDDMPQPAR